MTINRYGCDTFADEARKCDYCNRVFIFEWCRETGGISYRHVMCKRCAKKKAKAESGGDTKCRSE